MAGGVGENGLEANSQRVGCEHRLSQAEPMLMFGGHNTCLASSLNTGTAGPFFPTLLTAARNTYPGMLGSVEITLPLLSPWP